ncbi:CD276 antigen homolog [Melanotaenia boesemani]|uniref:CD276 antigen homolog n=1 Tax=Melanotaenia boesemani TaxID=1250792 RepID=UPI001C03B216|nr:CD276 antigen homolog [Melanotaenia boesemani]
MRAVNVCLLLLYLNVGMTDNPSLNGDAGSNKNGGEHNEDEDCPVTPGEFKENHIIEAVGGTNITLQCFPKFSFNLKDDIIQWYKDNNTEDLFLVKEVKPKKHKDYKDRISYSTEDLEKGNASITLSNVRKSDGGNYCCCIERIHENGKNRTCINQTVGKNFKHNTLTTANNVITSPFNGEKKQDQDLDLTTV